MLHASQQGAAGDEVESLDAEDDAFQHQVRIKIASSGDEVGGLAARAASRLTVLLLSS